MAPASDRFRYKPARDCSRCYTRCCTRRSSLASEAGARKGTMHLNGGARGIPRNIGCALVAGVCCLMSSCSAEWHAHVIQCVGHTRGAAWAGSSLGLKAMAKKNAVQRVCSTGAVKSDTLQACKGQYAESRVTRGSKQGIARMMAPPYQGSFASGHADHGNPVPAVAGIVQGIPSTDFMACSSLLEASEPSAEWELVSVSALFVPCVDEPECVDEKSRC